MLNIYGLRARFETRHDCTSGDCDYTCFTMEFLEDHHRNMKHHASGCPAACAIVLLKQGHGDAGPQKRLRLLALAKHEVRTAHLLAKVEHKRRISRERYADEMAKLGLPRALFA